MARLLPACQWLLLTLIPARFYHNGATGIFSDMKLIAELYQPTTGCIGIANEPRIAARASGPGELLTAEMNPREGVLAAQWLGLETVLPCHYIDPDCAEVAGFKRHRAAAKARGERVPESRALQPGDQPRLLEGRGMLLHPAPPTLHAYLPVLLHCVRAHVQPFFACGGHGTS